MGPEFENRLNKSLFQGYAKNIAEIPFLIALNELP